MNGHGGAWYALGRTGLPPLAVSGETLAAPTVVLIVGDDALVRAALSDRMAELPHVAVAGDAAPAAVPEAVEAHEPDVLLWDLGLHPAGSLAGVRAWDGRLPILALFEASLAPVEVLAAGAHGALPRDVEPTRLAAALTALAQGLWVFDGAAASALLRGAPAQAEPVEALTPREREVVGLVAQGLSNKAIGERLGISEHTAKFHVNAILGKLGAASRAEAVMRAVRLGLILV